MAIAWRIQTPVKVGGGCGSHKRMYYRAVLVAVAIALKYSNPKLKYKVSFGNIYRGDLVEISDRNR